MGLWKDSNSGFANSQPPAPAVVPPLREANVASLATADTVRRAAKDPTSPPTAVPRETRETRDARESLIGPEITIEGKISGAGDVRIAGRFKGDVNVEGSFILDAGSHVQGDVKAAVVVIGGELIGNIDGARRVDLLETGVLHGDVRAGSLTVAAGSRMRGHVEFGMENEPRAAAFEAKGFGSA